MMCHNGLFATLSELFFADRSTAYPDPPLVYPPHDPCKIVWKAQREWVAGMAIIQQWLQSYALNSPQEYKKGLMLCAPTQVISDPDLAQQFHSVLFSPAESNSLALLPCHGSIDFASPLDSLSIPLLPIDPLIQEQFCFLLTPQFSLFLLLGYNPQGQPEFYYSFDPEHLESIKSAIRSRIKITAPHHLSLFDNLIQQFPIIPSNYALITEFTRQLLHYSLDLSYSEIQHSKTTEIPLTESPQNSTEVLSEFELLQALTHEVRTPLTTIRTLTQLLLKKCNTLTEDVTKRLESIDQECTEQINRMELFFKATEVAINNQNQQPQQLTPISLEQIFQQSIPRWQKQAKRRNVCLQFKLPKTLPQIISDPSMLEQVLTGLMEKATRSLIMGGEIQVDVKTAGNQLKLQLFSNAQLTHPSLKSLGQLLMFQPETGCLSLNLDITKTLFNVLGGKLIVKNKPQQGQVLTIFLPLKPPIVV